MLLSGGGLQWNLLAVKNDSLHHLNHFNSCYYNVISLEIYVIAIRSVDV